ncbi:TolB family protein [candidate division KSB1 bacterium]
MKKIYIYILLITVSFFMGYSTQNETNFPEHTGEYLGQKPPGRNPELFAPGIVSTGMSVRDIAMTPDLKEIYFCITMANYTYATIMVTKNIDGKWTEPAVAPFIADPDNNYIEPAISPDGKKFFFVSKMTSSINNGSENQYDIWIMDRKGDGWGEPYNPGAPVNTDQGEYFPSPTKNGTLYFSRSRPDGVHYIYRSKFIDGVYAEPEKLPEEVNSSVSQFNAFVAQDESYIITPTAGRDDSFGGTDYYISFRNEDDSWTGPINMGDKINSAGTLEYSAYVSPDGRYMFFMATKVRSIKRSEDHVLSYSELDEFYNNPQNGYSDIYWIDASVINDLKIKK